MNKKEFESPLAKSVVAFAKNVVDNYENEMFDYHYIKKKQWYRTGKGIINQVLGSSGNYIDNNGIVAIANTPQELVQVGDLVEIDDGIYMVMFIEDGMLFIYNNDFTYTKVNPNLVTAIYTPNKDKKQYTLQWSE